MLSAIQTSPTKNGKLPINYKVASAEDLSFISSNSVDMVTSGQAAHWFKHDQAFPEIARILKAGGTLAFFGNPLWYLMLLGYGNFSIVGHPEVNSILEKYTYGGPGSLGPYWEEPGRSIVASLYRDIVPPDALYEDLTRYFFPRDSESGEREKIVQIPGKMTMGNMESYVKTWSSYHGWKQDFPDRKSRRDGGSGDIADDMLDALKEKTGWDDDSEFDVEWASTVLLARKRNT
jgi:ubiquinone/menaquinone biosynthesis C-methylase UbiE